ncbi:MAG: YbhB/YbcL family Raf kinase inhibitor-like protein, partial [Acidobacteria bacterium]
VKQGVNDFKKIGYGGPCPPAGKAHRYFFKIYALDSYINLKSGARKEELIKAIQNHVLAEGQLIGIYRID